MTAPYGLFGAFGVEVEYMLVDRETLSILPIADRILASLAGEVTSDVEIGPVTWSNELARHVIELKSTLPADDLRRLPQPFAAALRDLQPTLEQHGALLLPTAAHPWMRPDREAQLWPHEGAEIYETFDRIFHCRSHGWSNVQSVHLNLPFRGDGEFARLHAATRLLLPLLPALAASSPVLEGQLTGLLDTRMLKYAGHCEAMLSLTGELIPEPVFDEANYRREILGPIAAAFAPHDPAGVMRADFLNARGAIARFDRGSIELRVMDVQEQPGADLALCAAASSVLRALCDERWSRLDQQMRVPTAMLRELLEDTTRQAEHAVIHSADYLSHFGDFAPPLTAGDLWRGLLEDARGRDETLAQLFAPLQVILDQGTLATRICTALGSSFAADKLLEVYRQLSDCLIRGESFQP
ncbi:MAG: hypothetical protein KDB14_11485 [Planctomycetales bacterium]|nr:hypothetical protein [Planctomycetales bacterium]